MITLWMITRIYRYDLLLLRTNLLLLAIGGDLVFNSQQILLVTLC